VIIVECYNDESLIKSIIHSKIKHEGGKQRVLERVKKNNKAEVIGIIDEDPDSFQPSELKEYSPKDSRSAIKLLVCKNDERRRLVQISPDLEGWILNRARKNRIYPTDYGLPDDRHELHSIPRLDKRINFQNFLKNLIEKDEEIGILKRWLKGY
jgi:hypothetical protein